jgi:tetratricopeptide (TPR) repeat protein
MTAPDTGRDVAALLQAGLREHERGKLENAKTRYEAALALDPTQADALHLLGVIADQQGRTRDAISLIRRAIAVSPRAANFHDNLGTALLAAGDDAGAEAAYRDALALDPAYVQAHVNIGGLLLARDAAQQALRHYQAATSLSPNDAAAQRGLGTTLLILKRHTEALPHLTAALQSDPRNPDLRDLVAQALRNLGRHADAILHHRKAIVLAPNDPRFRESCAATLIQQDVPTALDEAIDMLRAVIGKSPDRVEALTMLGTALIRQQRPHEAKACLQDALNRSPDRLDALIGLSAVHAFAGDHEAALALAERANRLSPDDCLVLTHRGMVQELAGAYELALADYHAAARASRRNMPHCVADATFKRALLLLSLGRLTEGWALYSTRTDVRSSHPRDVAIRTMLPDWDGEVRQGQRILVWGEQGIGDQILYAGLLKDLQARSAAFTVACDDRLVPLLRRSFPHMRIEPIGEGAPERLAALADVQVGLGEVGRWLRPTLQDFPPPQAYLRPDPGLVAVMRERYRSHGKRLVVGIAWRSSNIRLGGFKSIGLADWGPVLRRPDILFVDLQHGDTTEERRRVQSELGVNLLHDDSVDARVDIDRLAAQAAAVDLLIGVSNSSQHIAAAAGQTCWIALPAGLGRLWYWFTDRTDSPWYPKVRLFRQSRGHNENWSETVAEIGRALDDFQPEPMA